MATIAGTTGDDILVGTAAADEIYGLEGTDTIHGGPGSPATLVGGAGDDNWAATNSPAPRETIS